MDMILLAMFFEERGERGAQKGNGEVTKVR